MTKVLANQEKHFDGLGPSLTIGKTCAAKPPPPSATFVVVLFFPASGEPECGESMGEVLMSGQVILYFDDQADALRFALAAGSVMSGESGASPGNLVSETARVTRIRLNASNAGKGKRTAERSADC